MWALVSFHLNYETFESPFGRIGTESLAFPLSVFLFFETYMSFQNEVVEMIARDLSKQQLFVRTICCLEQNRGAICHQS